MESKTITAQQLNGLVRSGVNIELIDVRTPIEFRESHVDFAKNVPLDQLDANQIANERNRPADQPVYLICKSGARGKIACDKFIAAGFHNVVNIEGGTTAWERAGFSVVRGKNAISLERQVRIAAGLLVLIGIALGYFVHPYLIGISAFVGAGLVFAGITDTCGMGMMLAKMPWNQVAGPGDNCKT